MYRVLRAGTKVWGIRNLKWFTSGTVVPEILPVWLWDLGFGAVGVGGIWGFKMKYDTKGYTRVDLDGLQYTSMFLKVEVSSYPLIPIVMVQFSHDPSW